MVKALLTIGLIWVSFGPACAQLTRADGFFEEGNYPGALELYEAELKRNPDNAHAQLRAGMCYLNTNIAPEKAAPLLEAAMNNANTDASHWLDLSKAYLLNLQFAEANSALQKYEDLVRKTDRGELKRLRAQIKSAQDYVNFPVQVEMELLGMEVNSAFPEYNPILARNGQQLLFTSRRKTILAPRPEFDGYYPADVYQSLKTDSGFALATSVGAAVNTAYDELLVGASASGDSLFLYLDHLDEFGDIYVSVRSAKGDYGRPVRIEGKVNTGYVESSASISPDGKTLVFASWRDSKTETSDLFMARQLPDGTWGKVQKLSKKINTEFNEDMPLWSEDGKTLYFTSNGLPGLGGYDLWFAHWNPETNEFSDPINMGYPVNGPGDERCITFEPGGQVAYMAAIKPGGYGDYDIYRLRFNNDAADPAIFRVELAEVSHDIETPAPQINIRNEADELIGQYLPSRSSGKYIFALYPGKYYVYIDADGFRPYNEVLVVNRDHLRQDQNIKSIALQAAQ